MTIITPLPTAPSRQDPATFAARADAFVAALPGLVSEINAAGGVNVGNATTLLGATWAAPGSIGSTTPSTGAFTTLAAGSGKVTVTATGELHVKGSSNFPTITNNGDAGIVGNVGNGIVLQGKGSSADVLVLNKNGDSIFYTPTGSRNIFFASNLTAYGGAVLTAYCAVVSGGAGYDYMQVQSTNGVDVRMVAYGAGPWAQIGTTSNHPVVFVANNTLALTMTGANLQAAGTFSAVPGGTAHFNAAGGRVYVGGSSSLYTLGVGYNKTRTDAGQVAFIGATDSSGPDLVISTVSGSEISRFTNGLCFATAGTITAGAAAQTFNLLRATATADAGNTVFQADGGNQAGIIVYSTSGVGANGANASVKTGKDGTTSRSINAGGTINASGADYAEYEAKAPGCGAIAKGQIVGYDKAGRVTDKWVDAISFGVKSTDPSYVGGDAWGNEAAVGAEPMPPVMIDGACSIAEGIAYWKAKAEWHAKHEAARVDVDRIAYAGKVPVNVQGAAPGDYIVPVKSGEGIAGIAVKNPTLDQYRVAVGQVRAILPDGRANIAIKIS